MRTTVHMWLKRSVRHSLALQEDNAERGCYRLTHESLNHSV